MTLATIFVTVITTPALVFGCIITCQHVIKQPKKQAYEIKLEREADCNEAVWCKIVSGN